MPRSDDGRWTRICEVCGDEFQQKKPGQRTCPLPKPCRARLPHNTGGVRAKAGLDPRRCQNPDCGVMFTPVRESQIAHSRDCLKNCPSYIEAQKRAEANRVRKDGYRRLENAADPELQRYRNLRNNMRRLHGIELTLTDYLEWRSRQDGHCKICGREVSGRSAHTDHDHVTGRLRDELCDNCNQGLGCFKDDPDRLRAAAAYIERHREAG